MLRPLFISLITSVFFLTSACDTDPASNLADVVASWDARTEKVAQIKDEKLQQDFQEIVQLFRFMEVGRAEALVPPTQTSYDTSDLAVIFDYETPVQMTEVFMGAMTFDKRTSSSFTAKLPFDYPFTYSLVWEAVKFRDGQVVALSEEYDAESKAIQAVEEHGSIHLVFDPSGAIPEGQEMPTSIQAHFSTHIPTDLLIVNFAKNEVGKTHKIGDYAITWVKKNGHSAEFEIARLDGKAIDFETNAVYIEAFDETGGLLSWSGRAWGNPDDTKQIVKAIDTLLEQALSGEISISPANSDDLFEMATERADIEEPNSIYNEMNYRGMINTMKVTIVLPSDTSLEKDIDIPISLLESYMDGDAPVLVSIAGPVYDHNVEALLNDLALDIEADNISEVIYPRQNDYNNNINFEYPEVLSDMFIDGFSRFIYEEPDLVSIRFFDAGGTEITSDKEEAFKFTIDRIEIDPSLFSTPPKRVSGHLPVRRMLNMDHESYPLSALPNGMVVQDNMLLITPSRLDDDNYDSGYKVYVTDAKGRYLRKLEDISLRDKERTLTKVSYYYGQIAGVKMFKPGEIEVISYEFDVEITSKK